MSESKLERENLFCSKANVSRKKLLLYYPLNLREIDNAMYYYIACTSYSLSYSIHTRGYFTCKRATQRWVGVQNMWTNERNGGEFSSKISLRYTYVHNT